MGSELLAATQVRLWFWKPTAMSVEELLRFRRGRSEASMQAPKLAGGLIAHMQNAWCVRIELYYLFQ